MHLSEELARDGAEKVVVETVFGSVGGRRAMNGSAVFLEVPYSLPPKRFTDPEPLPEGYCYPTDMEFIYESRYAVQPDNDGQSVGTPPPDTLGLGEPSENPLFLNIVCPPTFPNMHPQKDPYPVKVYIHGGFLQFGSPHGLTSQAQYVAAERGEVWVNIGYRLSTFGFIANDDPPLSGNYGFKDQWLAMLWIKDNIAAFGGDPERIVLTGLSAGAHSCHQLLHHACRLPKGVKAPFSGVIMQSNAIINDPKTPISLHEQYTSFMQTLNLDPSSPSSLETLQDPSKTPWQRITAACERLTPWGTFRSCTDGSFLPPDSMIYQSSPAFSTALREKGVEFLVVGDLKEEWYLYAIAHPIEDYGDVKQNLRRYYPDGIVERFLEYYRERERGGWGLWLKEDSGKEECFRVFGEMASQGQVHLPIRLLHRDLAKNGFPVLRYQIHWTPEQYRPLGYITHGKDRVLWTLRKDKLDDEQVEVARRWLDAVDEGIRDVVARDRDRDRDKGGEGEVEGFPTLAGKEEGEERGEGEGERRGEGGVLKRLLTLRADRSIGWDDDERWDEMMELAANLFKGLA